MHHNLRSCSSRDPDFSIYNATSHLQVSASRILPRFNSTEMLPNLSEISTSSWKMSCLSRASMKWCTPLVIAPPISVYCNDRTFVEAQTYIQDAPLESLALYGLPYEMRFSEESCNTFQQLVPGVPPQGLAGVSPPDQLPLSNMMVPEAKRLIYDSAKLSRLDSLLQELKRGDHRVLVYFQMTRMMDLMEEYLIYRQYKYLRLDGSSKLEDRRDMVIDWQTRFVIISCASSYELLKHHFQARYLCLFAFDKGWGSWNQSYSG